MVENVFYEIDECGREKLRVILKALEGMSTVGAINMLEFAKQTIIAGSEWKLPGAEPTKESFDELADKVARQLAEAIKKLNVGKPLT